MELPNCCHHPITCAEAILVVRVCSTKTIKLSMALSLSSAQPFFAGSAQSGFRLTLLELERVVS